MDTFTNNFRQFEIRREFFGYLLHNFNDQISISNKLETSSPGHDKMRRRERERDCLGRVWDRRFGQKFGGRGRPVFAGSKAVAAAAAVASRRKKNSARPVVWVCPNNSSTFLRSRFTDFTKPTPRQPTFHGVPSFFEIASRYRGWKSNTFPSIYWMKKGLSMIVIGSSTWHLRVATFATVWRNL